VIAVAAIGLVALAGGSVSAQQTLLDSVATGCEKD
jgi:hypothetical protein